MSMSLNFFGTIAITLMISCSQKYFSTRKTWQLGAIIPLLSIMVFSYIYFVNSVKLTSFLIPCIIIFVLELIIWIDGRHQYRKNELNKMKAKDL